MKETNMNKTTLMTALALLAAGLPLHADTKPDLFNEDRAVTLEDVKTGKD